jgi:hypothetical protein
LYYDFPFRGKPIPENFNLPPHVLEPKKLPIRDFVEGVEFILVPQNAYNSLQLLVKEHAEFISIGKLRGKHYYLMNVLSIVDCLDIDKSTDDSPPPKPDTFQAC